MAYLTSVHKASGVRHAVKSNFLSPEEPSLIVAKSNRAEIFNFTDVGLSLRTSFSIYGVITGLLTLRPADSTTDHLLIITDRHDYFTVSWDSERDTIRNERSAKDVADRFLRDAPAGPKYIADPGGRMLGVQVYEGLFLAIPILQEKKPGKRKSTAVAEIGNLDEPAALRLKELLVVDIAFLHGTDFPVLAVLHRNGKPETAQLSTYSIQRSGGTYELTDWEIKHNNLEAEAKILIPLPEPIGGVLVVGEQVVVYLPLPGEKGIKRPLYESTIFQAWTMIDRQRYLLGDDTGKLKMLFLELDEDKKIVDIKVETIGETSTATKLQYLGNGYVYVGSFAGDSQLVRLSSEYPKCRVLQNFINLAPIMDFQVVGESHSSTEGQQSSGQMKIVLGSGGPQAGALRSLRSGVGLRDSAILGDMEGVRALRALKCNPDSEFDDALIVSFINETRVFSFDAEGEVEELEEFKGFSLDEETLLAKVAPGAKLLQVTPSMIKVVDAESGTVLSEILSPAKIIAATANNDVLICDVGNKALVVYDLKGELAEVNRRSFEHEIACLYAPPEFPDVLAVCFWTAATVALFSLPGLETLSEDSLGGGTNGVAIPRSVIFAKVLENQPPSLLVAMGDGTLYAFSVNNHQKYLLSQKKAIALGTQAFYFEPVPRRDDIVSVFAACDHPSLVYSDDGRLMYSAVSAEKVTHLSTFNAAAFPSSVVILSDGELKISMVDTAQNIHVKTLKVGDIVRRVSYSHAHQIYGIVTIQLSLTPETSEERYTSYVRVVDDAEFAIVDSHRLLERELVECILCTQLDNGDGTKGEKFLVGTGFQPDPDTGYGDECKEGRILVLEFSEDRRIKPVAELVVRGAVKSLDMVGDMIVAALDKTVEVYTFTYPTSPTAPTLACLTSYRCHSEPIGLGVSAPFVAVGDLMKGPYILQLTPQNELQEICRTYQTLWTTAIELLEEGTIINADAEGNLSIWQRDDSPMVTDREKLRLIGDMRIGEMVNRIRKVDPAARARNKNSAVVPSAYLATAEGGVYLLGMINEKHTQLLLQLQTNLAKVVRSVGGLQYNRWRAFSSPTRVQGEPYRCVDGDFIQRFLELPDEEAVKVVQGVDSEVFALGMGVEEVRAIVEGLKTLH